MSVDTIKQEFAAFVKAYVKSTITTKSVYPLETVTDIPLLVVEVPISVGTPTIKSGTTRNTKFRRLVRLYFIDDSPKDITKLCDSFEENYNSHIDYFDECHPFDISSRTDVYRVFQEKDNLYATRIDINVIEIR